MNALPKEYNLIDILKFVCAIFVVVIHSGVDRTVISPIIRIAVPMFFIISSYLFFSKIGKMTGEKEKSRALWHLVKRNMLLYFLWTAVQLPTFIYGNHYQKNFFFEGLWNTVKDILTGKGFTGAWYIIALVLGTVLIYFLSKKISVGWLVLLALPLYIVCCLTTNYRGLFDGDSLLIQFSENYEMVTQCLFNVSLPGGLFWIALGAYLTKKRDICNKYVLYTVFPLFALLIALERYIIIKLNSESLDDCYFMLPLLCTTIFLIVKRLNFKFSSKFRFREISTLIYVTHGTCGRIVGYLLKAVPIDSFHNEVIKMSVTIVSAIVLCILILYLFDKKPKAFKYFC